MDNVEISPQLIAMFESSNDPWGIKLFNGERSFHFYSNNPNYHFLNLPLSFNVEGRPDGEIPHPSAEFSENFQHHDFEIKKQKRNISSIDIYHYGKELLLQPYLCEKFPFFYKKRCVGVIFTRKKN